MHVGLAVNSVANWTPGIGNASDLIPTTNFTVELNNTLNKITGPLYAGTPQSF